MGAMRITWCFSVSVRSTTVLAQYVSHIPPHYNGAWYSGYYIWMAFFVYIWFQVVSYIAITQIKLVPRSQLPVIKIIFTGIIMYINMFSKIPAIMNPDDLRTDPLPVLDLDHLNKNYIIKHPLVVHILDFVMGILFYLIAILSTFLLFCNIYRFVYRSMAFITMMFSLVVILLWIFMEHGWHPEGASLNAANPGFRCLAWSWWIDAVAMTSLLLSLIVERYRSCQKFYYGHDDREELQHLQSNHVVVYTPSPFPIISSSS